MTFRLDGDLTRIRLPSPAVPRLGDQLWRHTCFEAFLALAGESTYHEFNFAPSREWAVYAFADYRIGGIAADDTIRPSIAVRSGGERFELDAVIRLDGLSALHSRAALRVGLAAVIEADDGASYWGLLHPRERPDFHHAAGFALVLEPCHVEA
jgi:hypothetical protein